MRGQEYNAWSQDGGNPPYHEVILPFTRGLAGPMDFTPGIFNFKNKAVPTTHPQTTLAKQLSLYVLLYSPWQMAADMIENYEYQPALSFIESCPTNWEETRVLEAAIGQYLVIARRDRESVERRTFERKRSVAQAKPPGVYKYAEGTGRRLAEKRKILARRLRELAGAATKCLKGFHFSALSPSIAVAYALENARENAAE
jgi:hypothetical protein